MTGVSAGRPTRGRGLVALIATLACVAGALTGCGAGRSDTTSGTVITVSERDFHIATSLDHVTAGTITLRVHNDGPDQHELIVVPATGAGPPLRSDGFTVNEEAIQGSEPGSLDPGQAGSTRYLTVRLKPGRYLLFCNMEGHYMGGMHTELVVG